MTENKKKNKYNFIPMILILITGTMLGVVAISSAEVDQLCATNNSLLYRNETVWACMNYTQPSAGGGSSNDTLQNVTDRGATTTNQVIFNVSGDYVKTAGGGSNAVLEANDADGDWVKLGTSYAMEAYGANTGALSFTSAGGDSFCFSCGIAMSYVNSYYPNSYVYVGSYGDGWYSSNENGQEVYLTDGWSGYALTTYGDISISGDVYATSFIESSNVTTNKDILETFVLGEELLNPDGSINHEPIEECYIIRNETKRDYSRPVEVSDENGFTKTTFPYFITIEKEGWDMSCRNARFEQAFARLNQALQLSDLNNNTMIDATIISAEEYYTESKVPEPNINYMEYFDINELDDKSTHYSVELISSQERLNMEKRIVYLEGAIAQLSVELCAESNDKYTWCQ